MIFFVGTPKQSALGAGSANSYARFVNISMGTSPEKQGTGAGLPTHVAHSPGTVDECLGTESQLAA